MALDEINTKLANIALEKCEGFPFEEFANEFFAALRGINFIPVGGTGDGGADAIYETEVNSNIYYQMSIEKNHRSKIKRTIERLQEFGRNPQEIIYVTSQIIGTYDQEEETLSRLHKVNIRIRDGKFISTHLNHSEATKKAYYTHLSKYTDFLMDIDKGSQLRKSEFISHPSVFVFLEQQVENRERDRHLTKTVADSLILWALNNTDPDQKIFMTKEQIIKKISDNLPWAKKIIIGLLPDRLKELTQKASVGGKKINVHKSVGYCLPFETRKIIAHEKAEDEYLKIVVADEVVSSDALDDLEPPEKQQIADIAIRVTQLFFEKEGLNCSSFLNHDGDTETKPKFIENTINDRIVDALQEYKISEQDKEKTTPYIREIVRRFFYQSTENQRLLLNKFSRTYILLFTLQAEPRVVEYFQKATANFKLFVGTDLLIRAISERFLSKENQMTRNLFEMANTAGIQLILTEPTLDGLIKHLIVTDNEYRNNLAERENYLTIDIVRESKQILIRTFYHAKSQGYTKNWGQFLSGFLTYSHLHNAIGKDELKTYILQQFKMDFITREELSEGITRTSIDELASKILELKKDNQQLASDISLTIHAVYAKRHKDKEHSTFPEYGYQTWWLTQESRVQQHTTHLVKAHASKYIMRPEFLLNFFSLAPSVTDIRDSYKTIFPSVMGLQMGNHLPDELFHKVLEQVDEWQSLEEGRITARTRALCDKLKAEHFDETINYNSIDRILAEVNEL